MVLTQVGILCKLKPRNGSGLCQDPPRSIPKQSSMTNLFQNFHYCLFVCAKNFLGLKNVVIKFMSSDSVDEDVIWRIGVFDAHCHPTDIAASIDDIANMKAKVLTVMSTRSQDQELVAAAARTYTARNRSNILQEVSKQVIPAFGWHPWFSHQLYDDRQSETNSAGTEHYRAVLIPEPEDDDLIKMLPVPTPLSHFLNETRKRLEEFPLALVGEIGLDRSFRLPEEPNALDVDKFTNDKTGGSEKEYTPGSREGRALTPYRVSMEHQKVIFKAQLELAAEYRRPVSVHSVQAHGIVFDVLQNMWKGHENQSKRQQKRQQGVPRGSAAGHIDEDGTPNFLSTLPFPPRICMHSYSGRPDALKQFLNPSVPAVVYFSFSTAINFSLPSASKVTSVIRAVPDNRILIESDLHCAGSRMDELLKDILVRVCEIKGWKQGDGAKQLKENWERFIFGS